MQEFLNFSPPAGNVALPFCAWDIRVLGAATVCGRFSLRSCRLIPATVLLVLLLLLLPMF